MLLEVPEGMPRSLPDMFEGVEVPELPEVPLGEVPDMSDDDEPPGE